MTLIPWSRQSPAEKEPLDVSVCSLYNRLLLDTLSVGYVESTHTDGLLPLLQCMQYVNHNSGVRLLMITVLHGDAVPNANHSLP